MISKIKWEGISSNFHKGGDWLRDNEHTRAQKKFYKNFIVTLTPAPIKNFENNFYDNEH